MSCSDSGHGLAREGQGFQGLMQRVSEAGVYDSHTLCPPTGPTDSDCREDAREPWNDDGLNSECLCDGARMTWTSTAEGHEAMLGCIHAEAGCHASDRPRSSLCSDILEALCGVLKRESSIEGSDGGRRSRCVERGVASRAAYVRKVWQTTQDHLCIGERCWTSPSVGRRARQGACRRRSDCHHAIRNREY